MGNDYTLQAMRNDQIRRKYTVKQVIEYEVIKNVESIQRGYIYILFLSKFIQRGNEVRSPNDSFYTVLYKLYGLKKRTEKRRKNAKFTTGFICVDLQKSGEVSQCFEHIGGCVKYITYVTARAYFSIGQIVT